MRAIVIHRPDRRGYAVHIVASTNAVTEGLDERGEWHGVSEGGELPLAAWITEQEMASLVFSEVNRRNAERNA